MENVPAITKPKEPVLAPTDPMQRAHEARRGMIVPAGPFHCTRCYIGIEVAVGLCDDCESGARLITYADGMGEDRYFQTHRPEAVPSGYEQRAETLRTWRQTPAGRAYAARDRARKRNHKGKE